MDPLSYTAPPGIVVNDLDAKRTTATAGTSGVRIIELETGSVQAFNIIDFGAVSYTHLTLPTIYSV